MQIEGAAVLVTGGSRGLGAALGHELARRGGRVVLAARGLRELRAVAGAIRAEGGEAHALEADLGSKDAIYPLVGAASALVGPLDIVVHNAATVGHLPLRSLADTACEDFGRVLEVNLLGPFRLTQAVAGQMALRGHGLVLAISSDAAVNAYPGWGAYGVSKAALDHLIRTWQVELGASGVRFLTVEPADMDTRMYAEALPEAERSSLARPAEIASRLADLIAGGEPPDARVRVAPGGVAA